MAHFGSWPGYVSYIERDISADKTIIILTNHSNRLNYIPFIQCALYNRPLPPLSIFKEIILTPDAMQQFEGCYMRGADPIKIYETDGMLHYQQQGQNSFLLTPMGPRSFFIKQFNDTRVDFEVNQSGVVIGFILSDNGQKTKARKVN